jgi:hypothetical protein
MILNETGMMLNRIDMHVHDRGLTIEIRSPG